MISIDPVGLYSNCWFTKNDVENIVVPDDAMSNHIAIRDFYKDHYDGLQVQDALQGILGDVNLSDAALVPLQISEYFGWSDNTHYANQFDLLTDIQQSFSKDTPLIYTQYLSKLTGERVLHEANLEYLHQRYSNFVYDNSFEKLDNITQYLLPSADTVISVSSTLGLQAKFFGRKLISPSNSHLSYLADSNVLTDCENVSNTPRDNFMAAYLGRTNFSRDRLLGDAGYLLEVLNAFTDRRNEVGIEKFPTFETVGNTAQAMIAASPANRSRTLFEKAYPREQLPHDKLMAAQISAVTSSKIDVVSFDVFDTLVCRTVLKPTHVFDIMQSKLSASHGHVLSAQFISNFAQARAGIERLVRFQYDNNGSEKSEEMLVSDVYVTLLADYGLPTELADELVAIEQDTELDCLIPRKEGVTLFREAIAAGKKTIIISDFIHPTHFVERVLRHCGVDGWDHIFVSSDVGLKKHSGSLFQFVEETIGIDKTKVCHVGDNAHGDIKMAEENGWTARHIPAAPFTIRNLIRERKINLAAIDDSLIVSSILSGFGNQYVKFGKSRRSDTANVQLIANHREMGFLLLGPIMHFFAKWLVDELRQNDCKQIVFFARDTVLPFKMIRQLLDDAGLHDINLSYLPVSRLAVSGIDIQTVQDIYNVRIDDFDKSQPLSSLLARRFHLEESEIDQSELSSWTDKPLDRVKVRDIPLYAIYRIAKISAEGQRDAFQNRMDDKRRVFKKVLDQWGCDPDLKTMAVDFGYKGTIHKKISGFFTQPPLPRFFMSYANQLGYDPIEECKSFYLSRQISKNKQTDPMMQYNLLVETMINEGVGSALGFHEQDGALHVLRDASVDRDHAKIIAEMHEGAMDFSRYWTKYCAAIEDHCVIEPQMLSFLLQTILKSPATAEARLLADLKFDNGYAGHTVKPIIELDKSGFATSGMWPEGVKALRADAQKSSASAKKRNSPSMQKLKTKALRFFVERFCSAKLLNKFDRDPFAFFDDSSRPIVRRIGTFVET